MPGTDIESSRKAVELAKRYPGVIYASVGVHPEEVMNHKSSDLSLATLSTALRSELKGAVAVGEIGTDNSSEEMKKCINEQMKLFEAQCGLALELDLPIIVHTRNSLGEALGVLDGLKTMPRGQFHCFSHDEEGVRRVLERGFYISFCGNITWSKRVAKLVPLIPNDRLLLETDSPFMLPRIAKVPNSGPESLPAQAGSEPRNEPANVAVLAQRIAELRGQTIDYLEKTTTRNANRLFQL